MAVSVTTLQGGDIPEGLRASDADVVYRVIDGNEQYLFNDVEAAQARCLPAKSAP